MQKVISKLAGIKGSSSICWFEASPYNYYYYTSIMDWLFWQDYWQGITVNISAINCQHLTKKSYPKESYYFFVSVVFVLLSWIKVYQEIFFWSTKKKSQKHFWLKISEVANWWETNNCMLQIINPSHSTIASLTCKLHTKSLRLTPEITQLS